MEITFDPKKAESNYRKHGVRLADAEAVLFDPLALTREDADVEGERRFVTVGMDALGRVLVLVYTWRGKAIRLISARQATPGERKQYEG
jgi:hypothetical protein